MINTMYKQTYLVGLSLMSLLASHAEQKPNVIILYIDDMGIGDVECFGGKYTPTPNIDRLASEGIKFTQYYSAAPVSSPSRCGLTTGMYPIRHGFNTYLDTKAKNKKCEQVNYLQPSAPSMARAFHQAGYATAHIGKWHMGGGRDVKNAPSIKQYGFDEYISTYESPDPCPAITATNWIWSNQDSVKRWNRTQFFVDKSIDFIKRQQGKPFFLNLWPDDVHTPWVPEENATKPNSWETKGAFSPVLAELDVQLGRLFQALDLMGVSQNTIIIFTSDNGPAPSFKSERTNFLRGQKNSLYEGGINMPFIIRYPAKIKGGITNNTSVLCALDLYPSLCKMADIDTETGYHGDGQDYSNVLLGKSLSSRRTDIMWDFGRNAAFNFPANKYHKSPHLAIRHGNMKLLVNGDGSDAQLFDLTADRFEKTNIAKQHTSLVKKLTKKVCSWYQKYRSRELQMITN